jgi:hypothetical protein
MDGITIKTSSTYFTIVSFCIEQALQTFSTVRITITCLGYVYIIITSALPAHTSRNFWVSIVVFIAHITPGTYEKQQIVSNNETLE